MTLPNQELFRNIAVNIHKICLDCSIFQSTFLAWQRDAHSKPRAFFATYVLCMYNILKKYLPIFTRDNSMFADETAKEPSINDIVSGGRVGGHTVGQIRPKCKETSNFM